MRSTGLSSLHLAKLETLGGYRLGFANPRLWQPYIRAVCQRHGFIPCQQIRTGTAGTYPTFIVEERWVVKFFGRLFAGEISFQVEQEVNRLLTDNSIESFPTILVSGDLFKDKTGWRWPYLVYPYFPGVSIGEVYSQVSLEEKLRQAQYLGEMTRWLHTLPLTGSQLFRPDWEAYLGFLRAQRALCQQNQRQWQSLPIHLIEQIEGFLPPVEDLFTAGEMPHLIHADLTRDHILGCLVGNSWHTGAVIDWGDAMTGSLFYELAALHLDLFQYDTRLLRVFLQAYGLPLAAMKDMPRLAMSTALLHNFDVFTGIQSLARQVDSLQQLADILWNTEKG